MRTPAMVLTAVLPLALLAACAGGGAGSGEPDYAASAAARQAEREETYRVLTQTSHPGSDPEAMLAEGEAFCAELESADSAHDLWDSYLFRDVGREPIRIAAILQLCPEWKHLLR